MLYHQGSADLLDDAVRDHDVDVFLAGIAGRNFTPDYWARILPLLKPKVVVPMPCDDFARVPDELRAVSPRAHILTSARSFGV